MSTLTAQIQLRRDTSANWTSNNPILAAGEVAFTSDVFYTSTDQQRFKIGDGVQTWTQLDYVPEGGAGYPENLFLTVVNKTTDNLLASQYKVLKVINAQGGRLAVDYALADSDANSADTIGVVYENIDNNQEGRIITIGEITGINTTGSIQGETWADGDPLFLSDTIDGGITNVRPTAPNHGVRLGYVVNVNANNGKIYIKIDNGYELSEIHDVYAPTPTHNEGIFWSSGTTRYENKSIATALGYTPANATDVKGYALNIRTTTLFNPADSTLYFIGQESQPATNSAVFPLYIPKTGTIKNILISSRCTAGSSENSTFILFINDISNATLTSTYKYDTLNSFVNYSGAISVNSGDYLYVRWQTPAWVTNPTQIRFNIIFYIE
jgi:hypothetical protein